MKTTVEIPDGLYRQIKAEAAIRGQTVKAFLLEALQHKLLTQSSVQPKRAGWRSVFGKAKAADVNALQRELDKEFSQIDLDAWK